MQSARFLWNKGFTLVELLIVIALLAILATAVLAAINPLEQANRARDTRMRSDASQLLGALDRYFVSQEEFTWVTSGDVAANDAAYGFISAKDDGVGLCSTASGCNADGSLITSLELKTEFRNRDFIKAADSAWADLLYLGKAAGGSSSIYACWVPRSTSERAKATQTLTVGSPTLGTAADCATRTYGSFGNSCVVCLPQ
ncbi:MAG: type II secretion system protein [Patescibacteria group bacterium]